MRGYTVLQYVNNTCVYMYSVRVYKQLYLAHSHTCMYTCTCVIGMGISHVQCTVLLFTPQHVHLSRCQ